MECFWFFWRDEDFPPPVQRSPGEGVVAERLNVACTQTTLSDHFQRALVDEWCQLLPTLAQVKYLWLSSRVPQRLFDAVCQMSNLEGLFVKWSGSGIKNLDTLSAATRLKYFHLGSSPSLESIEPLAALVQLRWLGLVNIQLIRDIDPIGALIGLEGLYLSGDWTTQHVRTLKPIARLRELRYLSIPNLKADDDTLSPLFALTTLETFKASTWWKETELAEIRRRNPALAG
jgi:hypothetical protein